MRARVCLIANHKGGVGKTTVAVHASAALAEMGARVLLVDLDPNAGATSHLGFAGNLAGTFEVLAGEREPFGLILSHVGESLRGERWLPPGVDLLAGSPSLEALDRRLAAASDGYSHPWDCLRAPMRLLRESGRWDWIVCDSGPNHVLPTRAAYLVADLIVTPVQAAKPSADGLGMVLRDVAAVRRRPELNPRLVFLGAVLSHVDPRQQLDRSYRAAYAEFLGRQGHEGRLFSTEIPRAQAFANAWQQGATLFAHERGGRPATRRAAECMRRLARELADRALLEDGATGFDLSGVRAAIARAHAPGPAADATQRPAPVQEARPTTPTPEL